MAHSQERGPYEILSKKGSIEVKDDLKDVLVQKRED